MATNHRTSASTMEKLTETTLQLFAGRRPHRTQTTKDKVAHTQKPTAQSSIIVAKSLEYGTNYVDSKKSSQSSNTKKGVQATKMGDPYDPEEMLELKASDFAFWSMKSRARKLILAKREQRTTPTLANHYQTIRQPGGSKIRGMKALSPEAHNTSDTYHRFLQRSAELKIKQTVARRREIICTKECCKAKFCTEKCCAGKEDKKLTGRSFETKEKHLKQALHALGDDVKKWKYPGKVEGIKHVPLTLKARYDVCDDYEWLRQERILNRAWKKSKVKVEAAVEDRLEELGTSMKEIEIAEKNLRKAEMAEMVRLWEQEYLLNQRLERERLENEHFPQEVSIAAEDKEENENGGEEEEASDYDSDDEDDFPHLYANIPTPPRSTCGSSSQDDLTISEPKASDPTDDTPPTLHLTPAQQDENVDEEDVQAEEDTDQGTIYYIKCDENDIISEPTGPDDEQELALIYTLIVDLDKRRAKYQVYTEVFTEIMSYGNQEPHNAPPAVSGRRTFSPTSLCHPQHNKSQIYASLTQKVRSTSSKR